MSRSRSSSYASRKKKSKTSAEVYNSPSGFVVSQGLTPLSPSGNLYTYQVPYAPFYGSIGSGTFRFSFRHLPYDSLSGFHQDYWDWLSQVSTQMQALLPSMYMHKYDVQTDSIGSLEAFILAALSRIPVNDTDTIAKITTSGVFRMASQYSSFLNPDLHAYIFRLGWTWPALPKVRYLKVVTDDDQQTIGALARIRQIISDRTTPDLGTFVNPAIVDAMDEGVPAVQDALLLGLLARLQFSHQMAVNMSAPLLAPDVDVVSRWRKRFQVLSSELLTYLQRSRFNGDKVLVPLSTPTKTEAYVRAPIWLSSGEIDYAPWIRSRPSVEYSFRGAEYATVPEMGLSESGFSRLPQGTMIRPAESVAAFPSVSGVWQSSQSGEARPIIAPRAAYVRNDAATLLGGRSKGAAAAKEPKLFGFDPDAPTQKKVGGCAP